MVDSAIPQFAGNSAIRAEISGIPKMPCPGWGFPSLARSSFRMWVIFRFGHVRVRARRETIHLGRRAARRVIRFGSTMDKTPGLSRGLPAAIS